MKRLVFVAMVAVGAVNALAMPTKAELTKAQPLVAELMAPAMAEFKAAGAKDKTAAAVKVADTSAAFANSAETEAAKFLLLKGAVNFYTRGEQYDKAADTVAALQAGVKDVPPDVIAEITGKATGKISETKAPRLFVQYRAAKLQVRAGTEAATLAKKLKTVKSDALQRRYAEALAVSGNWKSAYVEFAKVENEKLKAVVEAEAKGQVKSAESGEFWWSYEPSLEDADDFFKSHAAKYYRQALAAGEITGLKKNIVEQRIAQFGEVRVVRDETGVKDVKNRSPREFKGFLPKHETLLWKNLSLDEVNKLTAYTCGKNTGSYYAESSHMKGSGRRKTFQFQYIDGVDKKCVGIELLQRDKDIVGRAVFARYTRGNVKIDFEKDKCKDYPLAASADGGGYGLRDLCVVFDAEVESNVRTDDVKNATVLPSKTQNAGKAWQENGNVATLTLKNGDVLEFAKCPAGVTDYRIGLSNWEKYNSPQFKRVKISRPFWIMTRPLAKRNLKTYAQFADKWQGQDGLYDYVKIRHSDAESFAEGLTDDFKDSLPKGYVVRDPTLAEWEYAIRANSRSSSDPYAHFHDFNSEMAKKIYLRDPQGKSPKNAWGIHEYCKHEQLLDKFTAENSDYNTNGKPVRNDKLYWLQFIRWDPALAVDPLVWSEDPERAPGWRRAGQTWFKEPVITDTKGEGTCRLVVGPDLVSEWRAKHGKK